MKGGKDDDKGMSPMFPRLHVGDTEKGGPRAPPRNKMALYEQLSIPSQRFNSGSGTTLPASGNNANHLVPVASLSQGGEQERVAVPPYQICPTPAESDDNVHSHSSDGMYPSNKQYRSESKSVRPTNYRTSNGTVPLSSTAERGSFPNNSSPDKAGNYSDFSFPTFNNPGFTPRSNKDQQIENRERFTPLNPNQSSFPTFNNPGFTPRSNKDQQIEDRERFTSSIPNHSSHSTETSGNNTQKAASVTCNSSTHLHSAQDKHLKRTNTTDLWSRQHVRNHNEENLESATSKDCDERNASHPFTRGNISEPSKHIYGSSNQKHQSSTFDDLGGSRDKDDNGLLRQEYGAGFLSETINHSKGILAAAVAPMGKGNVLLVRSEIPSRASLANDHGSCNEYPEDQVHGELQGTDMDRNDDASETSMVDSISGYDISPDDVVGVIGQRHFWKARRAIVNQQRLFAVQVFELHRLIKVQKLIAGSPHLLLEDTAYLTKPSLKPSPAKKHSVEYLQKSPPQIIQKRAEAQKPKQITEYASENPVAKAPLPSVSGGVNKEHVNHQSNHRQHHGGNITPTPEADGNKSRPEADGNKSGWSFHPPQGNQWLVPVMSPSEGLVYKPYTGSCPPPAGFMAPIYGGYAPMNLSSMGGEFPSPYGIPPSQHQGMGVYPNAPPFTQPYFSPYGMPMMNPVISASSVEHANPYAGTQSRGQAEQVSVGEVNKDSRTSRNICNQKSDAISSGCPKSRTIKESEIHGSTASSPGERAHNGRRGTVSEGRDALLLFPMAPAMNNVVELAETQNSDQQRARVIKVVPHNPRSATESVARIFQSIQEERQQYE